MGKKYFVRIRLGSKQYRLRKNDISDTHFLKKRTLPPIPAFSASPKVIASDLEPDNTSFSEACFRRNEESVEEWETGAVSERRLEEVD